MRIERFGPAEADRAEWCEPGQVDARGSTQVMDIEIAWAGKYVPNIHEQTDLIVGCLTRQMMAEELRKNQRVLGIGEHRATNRDPARGPRSERIGLVATDRIRPPPRRS